MRFFVWLVRAFVFFALFAFALNNQQDASVKVFFGQEWRAPMIFIVLVAFGLGCGPTYPRRAWIGLSALGSFCIHDLGRCPRLVWRRAFGPVRKQSALHLFSAPTAHRHTSSAPTAHSGAPKARPHTSPGQRPGFTAPTSSSPEGATHSPRP